MICPVCKHEGTKSRVTSNGMSMRTLMGYSPGYYDEDGKWIAHRDPNWTTTPYSCSNGHHFDVVSRDGDPDRFRVKGAGAGCTYDAPDDAIYNGSPTLSVLPHDEGQR